MATIGKELSDLCQVSWCVTVILLFGATMNSNGDSCTCLCSQPPRKEHTESPGASYCCEHNRYRYKCIGGYTRKAGTSNLIMCENMNDRYDWTSSNLICIPDPKLPALMYGPSETYSTTMASTKATQEQESTETSHEFLVNTTYTPPTYQTTQNPRLQSAEKDRIISTSTALSTLQASTQEPTIREIKSADPTSRTTSSVDTSTSAAEKESSVDSISDPQSKAPVITGVSVVGILVFALGTGLGIFLCKRWSHDNDTQTADEQLPMNPIPKIAPSDPSD